MDRKSFELFRDDATEALVRHHLLDALAYIRGIVTHIDSLELNDELSSLSQDYGMMLAFMRQGGEDPQRAYIHRNLINRSFALLDKASRLYHMQNEKDLYADTCNRCYAANSEPFDILAERTDLQREQGEEEWRTEPSAEAAHEARKTLIAAYDKLFEYIWTAPLYHAVDAEKLKTFLERQPIDGQAQLVSALMLNVQRYFDPQKFRLLLYFCRTEHTEVRVRALTAVVWTYMQYETRLTEWPDLCEGLTLLTQDTRLQGELILLQRQLLLSLETAKAEQKLQNEIFPDLIKNRNYQRNKMGLEPMEEDLNKALQGEPNAEWEQMSGNKQLADNMKKIMEMGKEGIDINVGTFSALKGFSFFQHIAHWFMPFSKQNPDVAGIFPQETGNNPIQMLMEAGKFCDSDKYSLCMMLNQIAPSQREMILTQIGSQTDGEGNLKDMEKENRSTDYAYRSYLQDLYRFYKLFPRRAQFNDPFKRNQLFTHYALLEKMMKSPSYLTEMGSFLIRREYYQDAIIYMEEALKEETANAEMLQKVAFCYQHMGNPSKAIYYYQQADLLNPNNEWILKQMYICYSALGHYDQELTCLKRLEEMNSGDSRLISEIGLCLMQLGRYEEAAQRFYELEYKGEKVLPSWRAIAWCSFKIGRLEQADKYYHKILQQDKASWEDYLNAGHTAWCLHQVPQAIEYYRQYVNLYDSRKKENDALLHPFDEDRDELVRHGIDMLDIRLMRDILQPEQAN
ncbi:MAG: hypothetical protein LUC45_09950 [Paraprevotella sp.]|nr:hypothetical protein [Paraprevotella sp.]